MTESNIDPTVIKLTQEKLGKYVKKPPLTEKLLKKPPFRFLHDVFSVVIRDTGCFEGLYTDEELNFENIKDRDDKMKFLQKMIDVIKITTNASLTVRTSKIVAGHEPEKTNELLQLMGQIIESKLDWKSAVKKINSADVNDKESVKTKIPNKQKDNKIKDKSTDKDGKFRERESKTKEIKKTTKTISPTVNSEKANNAAVKSREKEKANSKLIKKNKDSTEKLKTNKVKNEKTPSPNKEETKSKKSAVVQQISAEKHNEESESKAQQLQTNVSETFKTKESPIRSVEPAKSNEFSISLESASPVIKASSSNNSKQNGELAVQELAKSKETVEAHTDKTVSKESIARKTSANQSNDSPSQRTRRASASKVTREEIDINAQQNAVQNSAQLKSVNEIELPKELAEVTKAPITPNSTIPVVESAQVNDNKSDYKRESTFVRENSKDSTNNRPRTSLRPPSARPASARPGAPRRRDKNVEIVLQPNTQVVMSGINVKLDALTDVYDDGENLVIIEDANAEHITATNEINSSTDDLAQQGHLVQQILETQKELVQQNTNDAPNKTDKETSYSNGLNARQSSARQMNNLRDVIQTLTKSITPLGKLMDFIPEDIDAMQLEFTMWRDTYTQAAAELKRERSLTESVTEPMKNQLIQIEENIKEYVEMNDASRIKILQNADKIVKMLTEQ